MRLDRPKNAFSMEIEVENYLKVAIHMYESFEKYTRHLKSIPVKFKQFKAMRNQGIRSASCGMEPIPHIRIVFQIILQQTKNTA